ncbi:hypothetical protein Tco_0506319 [Tanacetum coccineum]
MNRCLPLPKLEERDIVSSKTERELVRINIDDRKAFWNKIEVKTEPVPDIASLKASSDSHSLASLSVDVKRRGLPRL